MTAKRNLFSFPADVRIDPFSALRAVPYIKKRCLGTITDNSHPLWIKPDANRNPSVSPDYHMIQEIKANTNLWHSRTLSILKTTHGGMQYTGGHCTTKFCISFQINVSEAAGNDFRFLVPFDCKELFY